LSLQLLRAEGFVCDVVERWLPRANVRRDFLRCIDIIGARQGEAGALGVQATSLPNLAARLKKAAAQPELRTWVGAGNRFECWAWAKRAGGGWEVKRVALTGDDLAPLVLRAPPRKRRERKAGQMLLFGE
jgi:hypothetical protein